MENGTYLYWILNTSVRHYGEPMKDNNREIVVPRVICNDGQSVSVQASEYAYCSPRTNHPGWFDVECGYPSVIPPNSWLQYAEDIDNLLQTVYAWIPIEKVMDFINEHGGENTKACFEQDMRRK